MALDKYGFPQGIRTSAMLQDLQSAAAEVEGLKDQWIKDGFGTAEIEEFTTSFSKNKLIDGLTSRVAAANSPNSEAVGRPEIEGEAVHIVTAGDVKLEKKFKEKIPLSKPDDMVDSAVKGMQINIDNLSNKLNDALQSVSSYSDAVTRPSMDMAGIMEEAATVNAKYMKTIFNKMNEFTNKKLNAELSKTISSMPATKRAMFADMKQVINQDTLKQYSGISNKIGGLMKGILSKSLDIESLTEQALSRANNPITPKTSSMFKDWIPNMVVTAGENIRYRNNVYKVSKAGNTGNIVPSHVTGSISNGSAAFEFNSFVTGNSPDGSPTPTNEKFIPNELLYGDTRTHPRVPICYAEDVVGQAISASREAIDEANNSIVNNMNAFLGDVIGELQETEEKAKQKPRDASKDGRVVSITDEEGLGDDQGGSFYITTIDAGTTSSGSVRNRGVGIASTAPGPGSGLTVDIVVSEGGASGTTSGEAHIKLLTGGTNYETSGGASTGSFANANTTGGSGSDCKATINFTSGVVTLITIAEDKGGTGYKKGDVLTVTGGSGSGCTFEIIEPRGRIDQFGITINKQGSGYEVGEFVTVDREIYNSVSPNATFTIGQTTDPGTVSITTPTSGKNKPQSLGSMMSLLGGMGGSLTSALNFKNIVGNVFPFELPPNPAVSDFFTLAEGGGGLPDAQMPSMKSIAESAMKPLGDVLPKPDLPFVQPLKGTVDQINTGDDVDYLSGSLTQEQREDIRNDPNIDIGY